MVHGAVTLQSPSVARAEYADEAGEAVAPHAVPSKVRSFFAGQNVLITGGSGFIGKVLIEKILRSFPEVGRIFVLLRLSKKTGRSAAQRLDEEITASRCFTRLREMWPEFRTRLEAVTGDIGEPRLGLSAQSEALICDSVGVVFHCAATVKCPALHLRARAQDPPLQAADPPITTRRFNEPLKRAFQINVDGTEQLIELCRTMRRLRALVHVSTAYVSSPGEGRPPHRAAAKDPPQCPRIAGFQHRA